MPDQTKPNPVPIAAKRSRFRFSLRGLLVLVVVLALPLGWIAKERRQSRIEMEIAEKLRQQGVGEIYNDNPQGWLRNAARIVLGERVVAITIKDPNFSDLKPLVGLTTLTDLDVSHTQVNDLSPLAACTNLTLLDVSGTLVSDLTPIGTLETLRFLNVVRTQVTDLTPVAHLKDLFIKDKLPIFCQPYPNATIDR